MTQHLFNSDPVTSTGSDKAVLDQCFSDLYNLRELISTPGYTAATPKLTLDATGNYWGFGIAPASTLKLYMSDGVISSFVGYNYATNTVSGFGTNSAHALGFLVGGAEKARIDTSGNLLIGSASASSSNTNSLLWQASAAFLLAQHISGTASGSAYAAFNYNATQIGSIAQSGTTGVAYNTSSDYRLKDNVQPIAGSGSFVDALKPCTWSWKSDGSAGAGFIAHELQAVSPASVTGQKDAVDAEGKPIYQAVEYGSAEVIAMLVAEVQDLRRRLHAAGL